MFKTLLCKLGYHKWKVTYHPATRIGAAYYMHKCPRCKKQYLVF